VRDQKALFREGVKKLKLDLTKHQEEQLKKFLQSVLNENKKFNLTGITDPREAIIKHLFDSLSIARDISATSIADIGSGAGFPGIPLAIVKPNSNFFLVATQSMWCRYPPGIEWITRHHRSISGFQVIYRTRDWPRHCRKLSTDMSIRKRKINRWNSS
jgi:hypothetical protein